MVGRHQQIRLRESHGGMRTKEQVSRPHLAERVAAEGDGRVVEASEANGAGHVAALEDLVDRAEARLVQLRRDTLLLLQVDTTV